MPEIVLEEKIDSPETTGQENSLSTGSTPGFDGIAGNRLMGVNGTASGANVTNTVGPTAADSANENSLNSTLPSQQSKMI